MVYFRLKRNAISNIILKVYRQRTYYKVKENSRYWIIIFLLIFGLILPCLKCIFNQISMNFKIFKMLFMTLGRKLQYGLSIRISIFFIQFSTFVIKFSFPFHLELCICILFYRCSEILSNYNISLRIQLHAANKWVSCNYAEFFDLVKFLWKLNTTLTLVSFYIILYFL